ncbi:carboxymuconolactone decarboxylase family protein [Paenibacillus sp. P26]|nr:carboxymuconolactone decarboxylase family protein [Paenibacillus sp. P26]UUZ92950.1 carboxymuconolactone decarboxylase family protein [Paenibacillus sp. P25]
MKLRINPMKANPEAYQTMLKLESFVHESGLDPKLVGLIKIRASQINGRAFCLDMHVNEQRKKGESEQKMHHLSVWRESPLFTEAEKAVLALTEAATLIAGRGVPDDVYEEVRRHFDEKDFVSLMMAIVAINGWNRLVISSGMYPGCADS